jgi:hypothetical protein
MKAAVEAVKDEFKQRRNCGNWVCAAVCWNDEIGQCLTCSPSVAETPSAAQAAAQVQQIQENAQAVDWTANLDGKQWAKVKWPHCRAAVEGGKFCPECEKALALRVHCSNCGAEMEAGRKFCSECGQNFQRLSLPPRRTARRGLDRKGRPCRRRPHAGLPRYGRGPGRRVERRTGDGRPASRHPHPARPRSRRLPGRAPGRTFPRPPGRAAPVDRRRPDRRLRRWPRTRVADRHALSRRPRGRAPRGPRPCRCRSASSTTSTGTATPSP